MNPNLKRWLLLIGLPLVYALGMWLLFDLNPFQHVAQVMSVGFLFGVPFGIGYLTIFFSPIHLVKKRGYRAMAPWLPIIAFLFVTTLLGLEGFACWIMIMPVFMVFSTIGGLVAAQHKLRRREKQDRLRVSVVVLLPLLLVPLEQLIPDTATRYQADTHIDIHAPAKIIW
ncbi:MAG TPA: hypothetical protein VGM48_16850, partial [Puia sp.]